MKMKMKRWMKCLMMVLMLTLSISAGVAGTAVPAAAKAKTAAVKKGTTFWSGNYRYKITSLKGKKGTATLIGTKSKKLSSVKVPETVKKGKYTLTVTSVGDNAFKNCRKLKSVTTNKSLKTIGKSAFSGCKKLQKIDITGTKLKKVGKNALKGIAKKAVIQVPEKAEKSYKKLLKNKGQSSAAQLIAPQPVQTPEPETVAPSPEPTATPSPEPTATPSPEPTATATPEPTATPTPEPTATPSPEVSEPSTTPGPEIFEPTVTPTPEPTATPTPTPIPAPTATPTPEPTATPSPEISEPSTTPGPEIFEPTATPSPAPTATPSPEVSEPSTTPGPEIFEPTATPSPAPTATPSPEPTVTPTPDDGLVRVSWHEHPLEKIEEKPATCTEPRHEDCYRCTVCENTEFHSNKDYTTNKALGHEFSSEYTIDVAPTATEPGMESMHCTRCDATTGAREIPATGEKETETEHQHSFGEWKKIKEPTCSTVGIEERICTGTGCDAKETREIPAVAGKHVRSSENLPDIPPTCTTWGKCDRWKCDICGQEFFNLVDADKGNESLKPLGHEWGSFEIETPATCTKPGLKVATCQRKGCGARIEEIINPIGHKWGEKKVQKAATCTQPGYEAQKCQNDGCDALNDKTVLPATGHKFDEGHAVKEPTCMRDGVGEKKCQNVGCSETREYTIPSKGEHQYEVFKKEATCTEAGYTCQKCSFCGSEKSGSREKNPALGHDFVGEETQVDSTCTKKGYVTQWCDRCQENIVTKYLDYAEHQPDGDGKCKNCGCKVTEGAKKDYSPYIWYTRYIAEAENSSADGRRMLREIKGVAGLRGDIPTRVTAPIIEGYSFDRWEMRVVSGYGKDRTIIEPVSNVGDDPNRSDTLEGSNALRQEKAVEFEDFSFFFEFVAVYVTVS